MIIATQNEDRPAGTLRPDSLKSAQGLTADRVFTEYMPRVYWLVRRLLGNDADAEDVTGQVFLQVVRKLCTFRGDSALSTWLNRVAVHEALAFRRRRASRHEQESPDLLDHFAEDGRPGQAVQHWTPLAEVIARETHDLIERAIARLPQPYRDVFVLAGVEGLANADIAERLGVSVAAVKSRLHRARLLLRRALAPYFEERAARQERCGQGPFPWPHRFSTFVKSP
jgi:RNA polymerase sigma-70 factor (ECF subfamily)